MHDLWSDCLERKRERENLIGMEERQKRTTLKKKKRKFNENKREYDLRRMKSW